MTKADVMRQVYNLSVNGTFDGEHLSFTKFKSVVEDMLEHTKEKSNLFDCAVIKIKLPDGVWNMSITRFCDGTWDYFIPETREEERKVYGKVAV